MDNFYINDLMGLKLDDARAKYPELCVRVVTENGIACPVNRDDYRPERINVVTIAGIIMDYDGRY